jgi:uncharacterized protein (DUF1778 family)
VLTEVIRVRVTPEEKASVQEAASKEQRTMSDWARLRLRTAAGLNGPVPKVKDKA